MNYIKSAKYRKLRLKIKKLLNFFNFKFISFDNSSKIILFWTILWIISLFLPWGELNWDLTLYSYDKIMWRVWIFIFFINIIMIFILMSNNIKEQIRVSIQLRIKDKYILLFSSILVLILSITWYQYFWWISWFYNDYLYLDWIKLSIISWIISFIWSFMYYKKDEELFISINNSDIDNNWIFKKDKNMKLPF